MKVFVVTEGTYSSCEIKGVFSTEETAQRYIDQSLASKECHCNDFNEIEAYDLDEELKATDHPVWRCALALDNGEVLEPPYRLEKYEIPASAFRFSMGVPIYNGRGIVRVESVKSAEHALKLAVEKRQEWLREKAAGVRS